MVKDVVGVQAQWTKIALNQDPALSTHSCLPVLLLPRPQKLAHWPWAHRQAAAATSPGPQGAPHAVAHKRATWLAGASAVAPLVRCGSAPSRSAATLRHTIDLTDTDPERTEVLEGFHGDRRRASERNDGLLQAQCLFNLIQQFICDPHRARDRYLRSRIILRQLHRLRAVQRQTFCPCNKFLLQTLG